MKKWGEQVEVCSGISGSKCALAIGFFLFVQLFKEGQRILERQRFQFPNNWLYSDNLEGEWGAFNDILQRKDSAIQTQVSMLQSKIKQEDKVVENRTVEVLNEWEKEKPVEVSRVLIFLSTDL